MNVIEGKVYILGNDINTDDIVPSHALTLRDPVEIAKYTLEHIDLDFTKKVVDTNIIAAGENFGTGSSREEAVYVFKILGVKAIIAKSFSRIYFRNLINLGLPPITLDWSESMFSYRDDIKIDLTTGIVFNHTKNASIPIVRLPEFLQDILESGGVLNKIKKNLKQ